VTIHGQRKVQNLQSGMFALPLTDLAVFSTGATTHVDVLFVDDHPDELQGLLAALAKGQPEWVIRVAASGREALALLQQRAADVVVSDFRMPGMDGGSLLDRVRHQYPSAVRLILSAEGGARGFMRATAAAHQVLGKPCDVEELRRVIEETAALQNRLQSPALVDAVHRLGPLPSLPQISQKLDERLRDDYATVQEVASLVASDPAIVARVLQIANSSYFRRGADVLDMQTAISRLGFELIRSLVMTHELYALLPADPAIHAEVQRDNETAVQICEIACFIAGKLADQRELLTVSVLCNVGKLLRRMLAASIPVGISDALLGAYLLSLWGLPFRLVQAVAYVDQPGALASARIASDPWPSAVLIHLATCLFLRLQKVPTALPPWDNEPALDRSVLAQFDALQLQAWEDGLRHRAEDRDGAA